MLGHGQSCRSVPRAARLRFTGADGHRRGRGAPSVEQLQERGLGERQVDRQKQYRLVVATFAKGPHARGQRDKRAFTRRLLAYCRQRGTAGPDLEHRVTYRAEHASGAVRETLPRHHQAGLVDAEPPTGSAGEQQPRRHLTTVSSPGVNEREMRERVRGARVGRLATVRADGRPHVVPVCFALLETEAASTIVSATDEKPKSTTNLQRLRNVRANPSAALIVDHYDENWKNVWWVRVEGRGRVVEGGPERAAAVDALREKYAQYGEVGITGAVLTIDVDRWSGWTYSD
jgi:PPOX class probable F420-dependent enzyme